MGLGKWIAGALGWAMFGPIGGILGYFFAANMERLAEASVGYGDEQNWNQGQRNSFLMSLLVLSAAVIKADGKVTSQEISKLREFFAANFGAQAADEAESVVRELVQKEFNLYEVCGQIRSCMDYSQRLQLFYYLVSLGACDGLHQREIDVLETIATYISLPKTEADSIFAQFRPSNDSNYRILGRHIARWQSNTTLTRLQRSERTFRKLLKKNSRPSHRPMKPYAGKEESDRHIV